MYRAQLQLGKVPSPLDSETCGKCFPVFAISMADEFEKNCHQTGSSLRSKDWKPMPDKKPGSARGTNRTSPAGSGLTVSSSRSCFHFVNAVRLRPGKFSCAINCFLEIWNKIFRYIFTETSDCQLFILSNHMSAYYEYLTARICSENDLNAIREPVWDYVCQICPSFALKDCNAQFSEIFSTNAFKNLTETEKSKIVSVYSTIAYCKEHVITNSDVFVNYISLTQLNSLNINVCNWSSAITLCNTPNFLQCTTCENRCQRIETQSNSSVILLVEFATDIMNYIHFDQNIAVSGEIYI